MKEQSFVDELNKYVESNPTYTINGTTITLKKWKLGETGYPVME